MKNILNDKGLFEKEKKERSAKFIYKRVKADDIGQSLKEGWIEEKVFANKEVKIKKEKCSKDIFVNNVWMLFAKLGFATMSSLNGCDVIVNSGGEFVNFDIMAADDETIILAGCFKSINDREISDFSQYIDHLKNKKAALIRECKRCLKNEKIKVIFMIVSEGYVVSKVDAEMMSKESIQYFNEESVKYYQELHGQLKEAARYQLLGKILEGHKISNLDSVVPAIEGKMGGHKYYSFSIEPEKLLKIGYVLHRKDANLSEMPTYQRLIKKSRLDNVNAFIENGGYFPNSIIINIVSNNDLTFNLADKQYDKSMSRIGLLTLPQKYKSAYIIDGQHRLYGYTGSKYAKNNTIPVVAFVNLDKAEQVKMFMDINENQKSVPKNLRNTLESDLLWVSEDLSQQRIALASRVAQELGLDTESPLFDRVIIGENSNSERKCITIDMIKNAILKSKLLNVYKNKKIETEGLLEGLTLEDTYNKVYNYIKKGLGYIKRTMPNEWEQPSKEGFICINVAINSFIKVISDVLCAVGVNNDFNFSLMPVAELMDLVHPYMDYMINGLRSLTPDKAMELKKTYGGGGQTKYWRTLQTFINDRDSKFNPIGLEDYKKNSMKKYNTHSFEMIGEIEQFMNENFKEILVAEYSDNWMYDGIPASTHKAITGLASEKSHKEKRKVEPWDCLHLIDYRTIATYNANWSKLFDKKYSEKGVSGNKDKKTGWMNKLNELRNKIDHTYSVTEEEHMYITGIHSWLLK